MPQPHESREPAGTPFATVRLSHRVIFCIVVLVGLYLFSLYNFLLFHTIAGAFSVIVATAVFILAWNTRSVVNNHYLLFIGFAHLFVAILEGLYVLAKPGMGIFPGFGVDLAAQLWLAARGLQAASLLVAPVFLYRRLRSWLVVIAFSLIVFAVFSLAFGEQLPPCFNADMTITPFRRYAEYTISLLLAGAIAALYAARRRLPRDLLVPMMASMAVTAVSELMFTLTQQPHDVFNLLAHYLQIIAFYLIYRALIQVGLARPYEVLFHGEKESAEMLRRARDRLEQQVHHVGRRLQVAEEELGVERAGREQAEELSQHSQNMLSDALEELEDAQQQLLQQERLRALGQMASGIAHDFNNSLTPVLGLTELLVTTPGLLDNREKLTHYLNMIRTAGEDAAQTVAHLREFYRQRDEADDFQRVELNPLIKECIQLTMPKWKDQAQSTGATICVQPDLGTVPDVWGSPSQLREAVTNLIINAVDALPHGGMVCVTTRPAGDGAEIEVADTGEGMDEETRNRCMEPFFTTKGKRGTGLGLAMVHGIIRRHNGSIDIESSPNEGTRITVSLPPPSGDSQEIRRQEEARCRPLQILLVDDEQPVRRVISELLTADGHSIMSTAEPTEALALLTVEDFDVLITDNAMPDMNGIQLAAQVKELKPGVPVIMLTGFAGLMDEDADRPPHVDVVANKPPNLQRLRAALNQVVDQGGE